MALVADRDDVAECAVDSRPDEGCRLLATTRRLADLRARLHSSHRLAHAARNANASHCAAAAAARVARIQRDWYRHHLEAAISSYDLIDLCFDPEDLISFDEIKSISPNYAVPAARREQIDRRCEQEEMARLRARTQETQKQSEFKKLKDELLAALHKGNDLDCAFKKLFERFEQCAASYDILAPESTDKPSATPSESGDIELDLELEANADNDADADADENRCESHEMDLLDCEDDGDAKSNDIIKRNCD